MSKKKTEFEFVGQTAHYQVNTPTAENPVAEQPTVPTLRTPGVTAQVQPTAEAEDSWLVRFGFSLREMFDRIVVELQQAKLAVTIALVAGVGIGIYYAWMINPVEWTGGSYNDLSPQYQQAVVDMAAELATYDPINPAVARFTYLYPGVEFESCNLARQTADPGKQSRFRSLTYKVTGQDCNMNYPVE